MRALRWTTCLPLAALALTLTTAPAAAQAGISVWGAVGAAADSGRASFDKNTKQLGIQVGAPMIPIAVRADAMLFGSDLSKDRVSWNVNAVFKMTFPVIQPYGIVGMGDYALTPDTRERGWNAGGGVRLGLGRFGIFVESRWHNPLDRQVTVAGITF